ncbi:hypothetical protein [Salinicoccus roseus]|uniref:hypothetical protein n=1 Tax=Salinicoccus roseus TaxID=45670 RepID=UPI003DA171B7
MDGAPTYQSFKSSLDGNFLFKYLVRKNCMTKKKGRAIIVVARISTLSERKNTTIIYMIGTTRLIHAFLFSFDKTTSPFQYNLSDFIASFKNIRVDGIGLWNLQYKTAP